MKTLIFLIVYVSLTVSSQRSSADFYPEEQAMKMVKIALKEKDIALIEKVEAVVSDLKSDPLEIYRVSKTNGEIFYAVFTQAQGRYEMFDYLVAVDLKFTIKTIRVLKYRSEHGGEIASKKWLEQFENYSSGELRYKKEISALSGATISANSIVADIPKVLKILKDSCN